MDFSNPIPGELDDGDELSSAAQSIMDGISALIQLQQQQLQMMAVLAQQMQAVGAARRVVRDETGRVIGSELAQ